MSRDSTSTGAAGDTNWYKALDPDELPEGRVKAVSCGDTTVAMTHQNG
ncbi:hypothetical protein [Halorubrum sp. SS7]|nr:hypothetical protein [Halorubrum sp. SS7]